MGAEKARFEKISAEYQKIYEQVAGCRKEWAAYERKDIKYREDIKHAKSKAKKAASKAKKQARPLLALPPRPSPLPPPALCCAPTSAPRSQLRAQRFQCCPTWGRGGRASCPC